MTEIHDYSADDARKMVLATLKEKNMSYEEFLIRGIADAHADNDLRDLWLAFWTLFIDVEEMKRHNESRDKLSTLLAQNRIIK